MSIILILNYSRSGGTILSKCLGALEDVIIISEVNPLRYAEYSVKEQAKKWYNIELKQNNYINSVLELHDVCVKANKKLIIRDWTFIDFTPSPLNNYSPSGKLSNMEILKKEIDIKVFCFVRDSIDIWISRWMPPQFFPYYKNYIKEVKKNNLIQFKYEDFCEDPDKVLKEICRTTKLNFSEIYKNYLWNNKVTGDTSAISRGNQKSIEVLKRKKIPNSLIKELNENTDMIEANQLMSYPSNYWDKKIEDNANEFMLELKHKIKNILGVLPKDQY